MSHKISFNIPKGYKGIKNEIKFDLNNNLAVITGLNGSGKTTLLKYIYEQYKDKKEIFFKTQKIEYFENNRLYRNINSSRYRNSIDNPTFDDVYQEIIDLFKKYNKAPYTHHHEIFSMLFDENSILYEQGYIFLEKVADGILSEFEESKNIKQKLGVPTEKLIEDEVVKKINQEIKKQVFKYPHNTGKKVYSKFKNKSTEPNITLRLQGIEQDIITRLRKECRKKSSIKDRNTFESYLFELISNNSISIESIVQQLSRRIYEDAKAYSYKTRTKKLWQELNLELQKYRDKGQFNYEVVAPSIYSSNYDITFTSSVDGKEVHFDSLSSGEKIIFELICYYFLQKNNSKNLKIIILDEFDANLNPALAEMYLTVVKEQFCKKGITTLLTTHSPSTVSEVEPLSLFSVSIEDSKQIITCAVNENGKKKILKELAPNFVYYGELGVLEYVLKSKNETIIFTEGKNDTKNFESLNDKYTFVYCNGSGNLKNLILCLKTIPFLIDSIKNKIVIFLFDFDDAGRKEIQSLLLNETLLNDSFANKIQEKKPLFVQYQFNMFISMMTPPINHSYDYIKDVYCHQTLKKEGNLGVQRQNQLFEQIIEFKNNSNQ